MFTKNLKIFSLLVLGFIMFGGVMAFSGMTSELFVDTLKALGIGGGAMASYAALPIWFKMVDAVKTFSQLTEDEIKELTPEERSMYHKAVQYDLIKTVKSLKEKLLKAEDNTDKDIIKNLQESIESYKLMFSNLEKTQMAQGELMSEMKKSGKTEIIDFKSALKSAWDDGEDGLKAAIKGRNTFEMCISKASQTYGDIDSGLDFAQVRSGIIDLVVRRPKIRDLFSSVPLNTEFYKFTEQETVVRDAQNVAKCAAVTSTTKETIKVSSIETKVVKDMMDFCRMFVDDYPFMQSRINKLLNESLALKIDSQLLLGDGAGENLFSIDSTASEFSAALAACPLTSSIQAATLVDLILGMQTQIIELGQQNGFDPNTVVVNKCDWFKEVESRKDQNNNYLDGRVTVVNGIPFVGGMMVMWTTTTVTNTCYVFDATKGEVVDRQETIIEIAFENKDNWEKQIATIQGYERLNFLVPTNWKNAFMKCSDIATAITAITKV